MPSSSSTLVQVVQAGSFAALNSNLNPSHSGDTVTFTATITSPGGAIPISSLAGQTVVFKDGTTILGTGTLDTNGIATFSTNALSTGPHAITAVYAGTATVVGSTSVVLTQTVLYPSSSFSPPRRTRRSPENTAVTFTGDRETGHLERRPARSRSWPTERSSAAAPRSASSPGRRSVPRRWRSERTRSLLNTAATPSSRRPRAPSG